MIRLNRPWMDPRLPAKAFQTFGLARPAGRDFWRRGTCEEYGCPHWENGWKSVLDLTTDEGRNAAKWIEQKSGRQYTRGEANADGIVEYVFPAGQTCFAATRHRVPNMRPPLMIQRVGDHRKVGSPVRRHVRAEDWRDHMQEQLGQVADDRKRG